MMGERVVAINGALVPASDARVSAFDRGLQFGDGLFETLLARDGRVLRLGEHLERLRAGASQLALGTGILDGVTDELIATLLAANALDGSEARVKVILTRSDRDGAGLPPCDTPTLLITTRRYRRPDPARGWRLLLPDAPRILPMPLIKITSALPALLWRQQALDAGYDDMILSSPDGCITESTIAALLLRDRQGWILPSPRHRLPSISQQGVAGILRREGHRLRTEDVTQETLFEAETIWATNALLGVMPVVSVNAREIPEPDHATAARVRDAYLHADSPCE